MERDFDIDLEKGGMGFEEDSRKSPGLGVKKQAKFLLVEVYDRFIPDSIKNDEEKGGSCGNSPNSEKGSSSENAAPLARDSNHNNDKLEGERSLEMEQRKKSLSNKKASKPPRPPRGPSLDAADQKLVREIAELAMLKRARMERMRALKKAKAAKASPSNGNLFSMVFTVLFFLVILFQGMSPNAAFGSFQGSPLSPGTTKGSLISVQYAGNPTSKEPNGAYSGSPNLVERISSFDTEEKSKRVAR